MSWPWSELGLDGPADLPEIRKAYARRLKTTHPEEDPEGFQRLHDAYQQASRIARRRRAAEAPPQPAPEPEEGPAPEEPRTREEDWDYDRLLEREPPKPPGPKAPGEPEWDYERLFAEGEAEAREARRRKIQELREKNRARYAAQEREQRRRAADQEEAWAAVMAAAHALELLMASNAPLPEWRRFLESPVFWNVRSNLDFIFALEDFLEQNPDLSQAVRRAIFAAYEFEKGVKPEYARLCRLLNVSRQEKRALRRETSLWRRQWRSWPRRRRFATVFGMVFLGMMAVIALWDCLDGIWKTPDPERPGQEETERPAEEAESPSKPAEKQPITEWEETALAWLEEDFGRAFIWPGLEDRRVFAQADRLDLCFWVARSGQRTEDWPGYRTNYPNILVMKEMELFARQWDWGLSFDSAGDGYQGLTGESPGAYLFDLPLTGAEEAVSALGTLLDELEDQPWYQVPAKDGPPGAVEFQVFLCHKGLAFYDALSMEGGGFDSEEAGDRYRQIGGALCRYILENSGLADRHMGPDPYVLADQGTVEREGETFFWVVGLDQERQEPLAQYFLTTDGASLICLSGKETDWPDRESLPYVRLGLENVGPVSVWDLVKQSR